MFPGPRNICSKNTDRMDKNCPRLSVMHIVLIELKFMRIEMFLLLFEKIVNLSFENFDGFDVFLIIHRISPI